jgi:outer membrane immunogenic protein
MRNRFFMALAAAVASATGGNSVPAADLPLAPPPFVYNWSGFYLGGHLGGAFERRDGAIFDPFGGMIGSESFGMSSLIGGAQIGFNYAVSPTWILGLEADATLAGLNSISGISTTLGQRENKTQDFGTVRARFGYVWSSLMFYGTGGYAWAHQELIRTQPVGAVNFAGTGTLESDSGIASGWSAGAGIEWAVQPGWTLRAEYLHLGFGARSFTFPAAGQQIDVSSQFDVLRIGVNYIFNFGETRRY